MFTMLFLGQLLVCDHDGVLLGVITKQSLLQAGKQHPEAGLSSSSSSTSSHSSISSPQPGSPDRRPPCRLIEETCALLGNIKSELAAFNRRFFSVVENLDTEMDRREKQQRTKKMKKREEKDDVALPLVQGLDVYLRPPRSTSSSVRDRQ
ncbi:chloride chloride channel family protein [Cystoisospora suis]|uniref:Chloride chloride channel family protein n=1 Tax=Cystoisospora suis TaxID=483139 RepID=A0A2C6KI23_9APIC|nr:chloride chloride channel family protein [Cystoisospora suis]